MMKIMKFGGRDYAGFLLSFVLIAAVIVTSYVPFSSLFIFESVI